MGKGDGEGEGEEGEGETEVYNALKPQTNVKWRLHESQLTPKEHGILVHGHIRITLAAGEH